MPRENLFFDPEHHDRMDAEFQMIMDTQPEWGPLDGEITPMEVLTTVRSMRNGKAPGHDGIVNEFLTAGVCSGAKNLGETKAREWKPSPFLHRLTNILNSTVEKGVWPERWRDSLT